MVESRILGSIREGRPVVGCSHVIQDESLTETLRDVDLDFLFIDMQHVAITIETLQRTLIALQPAEPAVLVRPLSNDPAEIGQILDAGADGVIVPMVNTETDARRAVAAAQYPPAGTRSWGPRRAARRHGGAEAYARNADQSVVVITQVETRQAIANLDAILSVPGLTGVMVGPADLAISLGYLHHRDDPVVQDAIQGVLERCLDAGVPFGFFAGTIERAQHWIQRGALIVSCSSDANFVSEGMARVSTALDAAREQRAKGRRPD